MRKWKSKPNDRHTVNGCISAVAWFRFFNFVLTVPSIIQSVRFNEWDQCWENRIFIELWKMYRFRQFTKSVALFANAFAGAPSPSEREMNCSMEVVVGGGGGVVFIYLGHNLGECIREIEMHTLIKAITIFIYSNTYSAVLCLCYECKHTQCLGAAGIFKGAFLWSAAPLYWALSSFNSANALDGLLGLIRKCVTQAFTCVRIFNFRLCDIAISWCGLYCGESGVGQGTQRLCSGEPAIPV